MKNVGEYTFLVRYGLIVGATKIAEGGWLPKDLAREIAIDPATIELTTGLAVGGATVFWYWGSRARKALRAYIAGLLD